MQKHVILESIYKPSEDVVARDVQGEFVIIPITSGIGDGQDDIFTMNDTGRVVWDHLDGKRTLKEIGLELSGKYDAAPGQVEQDVAGIVQELLNKNIVVEVPAV